VVQGRNDPEPGKLIGVISLSDVMKTVIVGHHPTLINRIRS
jgi:hypothetical protein